MPVLLLVILSFFDICGRSETQPATALPTPHATERPQVRTGQIDPEPDPLNLIPINRDPGRMNPTRLVSDHTAPLSLTVDTLTLQQLESRTSLSNDTLYIVNFWATWCKPCVKELPFFEEAGMKFADSPVKILLVSLDMLSDVHKVSAFAATHLRRNKVYLLRAGNPDVWINAIDPHWSGAIPATAFYRKGKKLRFHEGELTQPELFQLIHSFLQ